MNETVLQKTRNILITGDSGPDYDIYVLTKDEAPLSEAEATIMRCTPGGAGLAHRLLSEVIKENSTAIAIGYRPQPEPAVPTVAVWHPKPTGDVIAKSQKLEQVWRIQRSISLGDVKTTLDLQQAEKLTACDDSFKPDVVLIEDNACRFRHPKGDWTKTVAPWMDNKATIIWKMTAPLCHGSMWWRAIDPDEDPPSDGAEHADTAEGLAEKQTRAPDAKDRLIVVLPVEALRRGTVRVSQRISWERTALDLARELSHNPTLADLRKARHVVVTLNSEGALWMRRGEGHNPPSFRLFFDPSHMEQEWVESREIDGEVYGYLTTFVVSLAAYAPSPVVSSPDPKQAAGAADIAMAKGITQGLLAMRALRAYGHGPVAKNQLPAYPAALLGAIIRDGEKEAMAAAISPLNLDALGQFGEIEIPAIAVASEDFSWRIVETGGETRSNEPLYGLARRVALYGEAALRSVPYARFGQMLIVDRRELESLKVLKTLIEDYKKNENEHKPLSLAVFGPPGSGKSFGVEQIAKGVLGDDCPILTFNLSQFKDGDLIGAFHQVRDKVLEGHLPVVFWDEFDSGNYKWLQFLLSPMQDGKFQEGQFTHPIGRCVFVFAGGTSYDMEHFGPPDPNGDSADDSTIQPPQPSNHEMQEKQALQAQQRWNDFKLLKGPDFVSRVHGSLNVLGPDRRRQLNISKGRWEDDLTDTCFPVRRALLLRAKLKIDEKSRLKMDYGLLGALLEVSCYTNGARSFTKICESMGPKRPSYSRSDLPPDEVLAMNLGRPDKHLETLAEFKDILDRDHDFENNSQCWKLAQAIHEEWRKEKKEQMGSTPFDYNCEYKLLPPDMKKVNLSAAARMPRNLLIGGLYLVPKDKAAKDLIDKIPEDLVDFMAQEEHFLWMEHAVSEGFRQIKEGERRNVKDLIHNCLVSWEDLPEDQRKYDRQIIRNYPRFAELAGYAIVARKPFSGSKIKPAPYALLSGPVKTGGGDQGREAIADGKSHDMA